MIERLEHIQNNFEEFYNQGVTLGKLEKNEEAKSQREKPTEQEKKDASKKKKQAAKQHLERISKMTQAFTPDVHYCFYPMLLSVLDSWDPEAFQVAWAPDPWSRIMHEESIKSLFSIQ